MTESVFISELEREQGYLEKASLALMGNHSDAEDAFQEACLRAFVSREQLQGGTASFRPWMKRILLNVCLRNIEKRRRVIPLGLRSEVLPEETTSHDELGAVWSNVRTLNPALRETIVLRYVFDLSQEQVSEQMKVPLGTVKSRINRALEQLRAEFAAQGEEDNEDESRAGL